MKNTVIQGDCLEEMKSLPENSVDAIVTDPPYGLEFMGKDWDKGVPGVEFWVEMLRVLKPGGHLLSFSGTRTYHRMASAIEDAGFEVRDMIEWVYGSGFPKSLNIGKAVDKLQGNEREEIRDRTGAMNNSENSEAQSFTKGDVGFKTHFTETKGSSPYEGWGTALKPAHEPICMARKPLAEKTVAENVLKYGTGGINIDESRVAANWKEERPESWFNSGKSKSGNPTFDGNLKSLTDSTVGERLHDAGRFPANLILSADEDGQVSEEVRECFPETKSTPRTATIGGTGGIGVNTNFQRGSETSNFNDSGNASRFFKSIIYQAKASKSERNKGCEGLEEKAKVFNGQSDKSSEDMKDVEKRFTTQPKANNHPTVKPIALMEYLIKMVTPNGGIVLDPFMGSGSTGVACKNLNCSFIGIELDPSYIEIANKRLNP